MSDTKPPSPKPMPTTSLPDRHDPKEWSDMDMRKGMSSSGNGDPTRKTK